MEQTVAVKRLQPSPAEPSGQPLIIEFDDDEEEEGQEQEQEQPQPQPQVSVSRSTGVMNNEEKGSSRKCVSLVCLSFWAEFLCFYPLTP